MLRLLVLGLLTMVTTEFTRTELRGPQLFEHKGKQVSLMGIGQYAETCTQSDKAGKYFVHLTLKKGTRLAQRVSLKRGFYVTVGDAMRAINSWRESYEPRKYEKVGSDDVAQNSVDVVAGEETGASVVVADSVDAETGAGSVDAETGAASVDVDMEVELPPARAQDAAPLGATSEQAVVEMQMVVEMEVDGEMEVELPPARAQGADPLGATSEQAVVEMEVDTPRPRVQGAVPLGANSSRTPARRRNASSLSRTTTNSANTTKAVTAARAAEPEAERQICNFAMAGMGRKRKATGFGKNPAEKRGAAGHDYEAEQAERTSKALDRAVDSAAWRARHEEKLSTAITSNTTVQLLKGWSEDPEVAACFTDGQIFKAFTQASLVNNFLFNVGESHNTTGGDLNTEACAELAIANSPWGARGEQPAAYRPAPVENRGNVFELLENVFEFDFGLF
jgi:hypothetical protein